MSPCSLFLYQVQTLCERCFSKLILYDNLDTKVCNMVCKRDTIIRFVKKMLLDIQYYKVLLQSLQSFHHSLHKAIEHDLQAIPILKKC